MDKFLKQRFAMAGLIILSLLILMTFFGPLMSGYTYQEINLSKKNQPPSMEFWFGTDDLGRDLFTRTWYGARISLFVGLAAALVDGFFGVMWGSIAALAGKNVDRLLMSIADILYSLPYLLIVILLMVVMSSGIVPILIALTILGWITMARIVRAQVLQIKEKEYVLAAKAQGANFFHLLRVHILPNALPSILVTITFTVPSAIFVEAFLSFLGLGIQAPMPSWGMMAYDALPSIQYYPWRLLFPATFICLTILSFNLLGDGLRDCLDPRQYEKK